MLKVVVGLAATVAVLSGTAEAKPGQACQTVASDSARARAFVSKSNYTTNGYAMRRQGGVSRCEFTAPGEGSCSLQKPGLVHVTTARTNAFFDIPRGRSAEIVVAGGVALCRTT